MTTEELELLENVLRDPLSGLTWDNRIMAADAIAEVIATRRASGQATSESAEPVAWRYRFADPLSGKPVWRYSPSLWNGQKPQEVQTLYAHPAPVTVEAAALVQKHLHDIINCGNCSGSRHSARLALRALSGEKS